MRIITGLLLASLSLVLGQPLLRAANADLPPNYYPLKPGMKWHYRVDAGNGQQGKMTLQVAKIETIDGEKLARVESVVGGQIRASEHLGITAKGLFRYRFNGVEAMPPVCLLKFPIKAGETWEADVALGQEMSKISCRIGEEEIEVPAGKFKTVTSEIATKMGEIEVSTTYWFAENIGVVRQRIEVGGKVFVVELEEVVETVK